MSRSRGMMQPSGRGQASSEYQSFHFSLRALELISAPTAGSFRPTSTSHSRTAGRSFQRKDGKLSKRKCQSLHPTLLKTPSRLPTSNGFLPHSLPPPIYPHLSRLSNTDPIQDSRLHMNSPFLRSGAWVPQPSSDPNFHLACRMLRLQRRQSSSNMYAIPLMYVLLPLYHHDPRPTTISLLLPTIPAVLSSVPESFSSFFVLTRIHYGFRCSQDARVRWSGTDGNQKSLNVVGPGYIGHVDGRQMSGHYL